MSGSDRFADAVSGVMIGMGVIALLTGSALGLGPILGGVALLWLNRGVDSTHSDLQALVLHEQAEMESWLAVMADPPCRYDRSSSAQHRPGNLVTMKCPGYDPITTAELGQWLRRVRDEMHPYERAEVKRARALVEGSGG